MRVLGNRFAFAFVFFSLLMNIYLRNWLYLRAKTSDVNRELLTCFQVDRSLIDCRKDQSKI